MATVYPTISLRDVERITGIPYRSIQRYSKDPRVQKHRKSRKRWSARIIPWMYKIRDEKRMLWGQQGIRNLETLKRYAKYEEAYETDRIKQLEEEIALEQFEIDEGEAGGVAEGADDVPSGSSAGCTDRGDRKWIGRGKPEYRWSRWDPSRYVEEDGYD